MNFPYRIVDLTHSLSIDIPTWDGGCGFVHTLKVDYDDCTTDVKFRVQQLSMHAGIGTHMDAPAHCIPGGAAIDQLDLQHLVAPCVVIDVSQKSHESYSVTAADIHGFEQTYGATKPGSFVIIRTGWDKLWHQPDRYRNNHIFPSISLEAAQLLLSRQIAGLGIDTLSPDRPEDGYPVHKAILGAGKYIVENIANAAKLPPVGSYSIALPIKIAGGTEAPIRLIALVAEDKE